MSKASLIPLIAVVAMFSAACSSSGKNNEERAKSVATGDGKPTQKSVLSQYSIKQLDGAATALRAIYDLSLANPDEDHGFATIGCSMPGDKAQSLMMPIKALIDSQMQAEVVQYTGQPGAYAESMNFSQCGQSCSCGVFSNVLEAASKASFDATELKLHNRFSRSLATKAKVQTAYQTQICAKQQTWFCGSDLQSYLEAQAANGP